MSAREQAREAVRQVFKERRGAPEGTLPKRADHTADAASDVWETRIRAAIEVFEASEWSTHASVRMGIDSLKEALGE